jgi:hypothetical protein
VDSIIGAVVGGLLAILSGFVVILATNRREGREWTRDTQLKLSADLLAALHSLSRRVLDLAFMPTDAKYDRSRPERALYHEATIEWNSALSAALLMGSPEFTGHIMQLDKEVDRLLGLALQRQWTWDEFRPKRTELGEMGATYLNLVRRKAELKELDLKSIWAWADDLVRPRASTEQPEEPRIQQRQAIEVTAISD